MTDDLTKQLGEYTGDKDILAIEKTLPEAPAFVRELRKVLALLPPPTPPEIDPVRAADPSQKSSTVLTETGYANSQTLSAPGFGSIPAASVGVELPYVGLPNMLLDPMFEHIANYADAPLRSASNLVESGTDMNNWAVISRVSTSYGLGLDVAWMFAQENINGASYGAAYLWEDGDRDEQTWFNSAPVYIGLTGYQNGTHRCAISSYPFVPEDAGGQFTWLIGTMRVTQVSWNALVQSAKLILRLVKQTPSPVIVAQKEYDAKTFNYNKVYRLDVFYQFQSDANYSYNLQLVMEFVYSGTSGTGIVTLDAGDPQLHVALGPQPVELAPKLGTYWPSALHASTYSSGRQVIVTKAEEYQARGTAGWMYELEAGGHHVYSALAAGATYGQLIQREVLRQQSYVYTNIPINARGLRFEPYPTSGGLYERAHFAFAPGGELYVGPVYPTSAAVYSRADSGSLRWLTTAHAGAHYYVSQYASTGLQGGAKQRALKSLHHAAVDLRAGKGVYRLDGGNHVNFLRTWRWLDDYGWWWPIWQASTTQDQAPGLDGQQILASGGSGQSYSTSTPVTGDPKSKSLVANGSGGYATGSQFTLPDSASFDGFLLSAWVYWDAYANDDDVLLQVWCAHATYPKSYTINLNHSGGGISIVNKNEYTPYNYRESYYDRAVLTAAAWHHILVAFDYDGYPDLWVDGVFATKTTFNSGSPGTYTDASDLYLFRNKDGTQLGAGKIAHIAIVPAPLNAITNDLHELPRLLGLSHEALMQTPIHLNGRLVNIAEQDVSVGYDGSNRVNAVDLAYAGTTFSQTDVTYNGDGTVNKVETVIDGHTITLTPTYSGGYVTGIAKVVI